MKMRSSIVAAAAVVLALSTVTAGAITEQPQPCWLSEPAADGEVGVFGVARDLDANGASAVRLSRYRALQSLARYFDAELLYSQAELDPAQRRFVIGGRAVEIVEDYAADGYVYSYAAVGKSGHSAARCAVTVCQFDQCMPAWLCAPNPHQGAGVIGVSYTATDLPSQYQAATRNALEQLELMYGVAVASRDTIIDGATSGGALHLVRSEERVQTRSGESAQSVGYLVSESCSRGATLILRVIVPKLPAAANVSSTVWLREPSAAGQRGALGVVQGRVASGLLSDKIKLAIRRGLVELAKGRDSRVREEQLVVSRNGARYSVSTIQQETNVTLSARVNGIHFLETAEGLSVYVWVVEVSDARGAAVERLGL
jgi:hypothetical protein